MNFINERTCFGRTVTTLVLQPRIYYFCIIAVTIIIYIYICRSRIGLYSHSRRCSSTTDWPWAQLYCLPRQKDANNLAGLRIVLCLKDVKISLRIIVLIVRGCFDQTHGLNKLFLHLMRALLILNYEKPCRIFPYMLLEKFTQLFRTKKNFWTFYG